MRRCDRPNADGGVDEELAAVCPPGVSPVATIGLAGVTAAFRPRCWFTGPQEVTAPAPAGARQEGAARRRERSTHARAGGPAVGHADLPLRRWGTHPPAPPERRPCFSSRQPSSFRVNAFEGVICRLLYGFPQRARAGNNRGDMTRLMPGLPRGVGIRRSMPAARPIASGCPARRQAVLRRWLGIQWNSKDPTKITSKTPPGHFGVKATSPQMSPPRPGSPVATT